VDARDVVAKALAEDASLPLVAGGGALAAEMIRVNHYGVDASPDVVLSSLAALGGALAGNDVPVDPRAARRAVDESWK
jgi:aspartate aminotransferase-like enzyme